MPRTWAITGGSGYVGHLLATRLVAAGDDVRVLTRSAEPTIPPAVTSVTGGLSDRRALADLVEAADVVVHLAGFVHRPVRTDKERAECFETNVGGTARLVEAIKDRSPDAFVIGVSTSNVYGRQAHAVPESEPEHPVTPYGLSKLQAEHVLRDSGVRFTIVRPAMVLGPGAPGNFLRLVRMVNRGFFPQIGESPRKSIVPVEDLVDALALMADRQHEAVGQIFNVGASGEVLTMREIAETIAASLDRKVRMVRVPAAPARLAVHVVERMLSLVLPSAPSVQQMFDTFTAPAVIDDGKVRRTIGFRGRAGVRNTIDATVRAYRARFTSAGR